MFVDTHAHIYSEELIKDIDTVIAEAKEQNVEAIFMPNIDATSIQPMLQLSDTYDFVHPMIGLHPCYVKGDVDDVLKTISKEAERGGYVGIGEVGIDLYWDKTFVAEQHKAFEYQIAMARDMNLPVILHSRDSLDHTIEGISKYQNGNLTGIFHCFNGTIDQSKAILDLGFYMGAGGVVTFKNSGMADVYKSIPLESIVLETDAPYLSPAPYRGKVNVPMRIPVIAEKIADIQGVELAEVAKITTKNAYCVFDSVCK